MNKQKVNWISENEAAKLMNYQPKTLRRYAREGRLQIAYTKVNYKTYEYNQYDIDIHKMNNSTIMN
jgi:DNA-binding transcriptional MerR regulator